MKRDTALAYPQPQLYLDGQWLDAEGRQTEDIINPANGQILAQLPHASRNDLDNALAAAQSAFGGWRATAPLERARILRAAATLLRERVDTIAHSMTLEQGKPLREARLELLAAADTYDWYADEGRRNYGRVVPGRTLTQRTLILKLAEETPACGLALVRALHDAGLPRGVLQAVFGVPAQISSYLLDSPVVAKFSFTGSTAVGKLLAQQAAKTLKRATMECARTPMWTKLPRCWWQASFAMLGRSASPLRAFMFTEASTRLLFKPL